LKEATEP